METANGLLGSNEIGSVGAGYFKPLNYVPIGRSVTTSAYRASPESTGGSGTKLEQEYGAVLLTHLLAEVPWSCLGEGGVVEEVRFQASAVSPIDDFVVSGSAHGSQRTVAVSARRRPVLTSSSDTKTIKMFVEMVRAYEENREDALIGRWRLALVALPSKQMGEVAKLCEIARTQSSSANFEAAVKARNAELHKRFVHMEGLFQLAAKSFSGSEICSMWDLLRALWPVEFRHEGTRDDIGRAVGDLKDKQAALGLRQDANIIFNELVKISSSLAPQGGYVDRKWLIQRLAENGLVSAVRAAPSLDLSPHRRAIHRFAEALTQEPFALPDYTLRERMRDIKPLQELLSMIPETDLEIKRYVRQHKLSEPESYISKQAEALIDGAEALRADLRALARQWDFYYQGKPWPEKVTRDLVDEIEACLTRASSRATNLRAEACAVMSHLEEHHMGDL